MASLQSGQVEMFVNITGASEEEAREKLQACRGDLNAAIDSYLSEKENSVAPVRIEEADTSDWMDEEPRPRHQRAAQPFYPLPSPPTWSRMLPSIRGFGFEGTMASRFPNRGTSPFVTQPWDIREIPIDWKDEEPRVRSSSGLIIEEIPATAESSLPSQMHPHFVFNDEDVSRPFSSTVRRNGARSTSDSSNTGSGLNTRQRSHNSPLVDEVIDVMTKNESNNVEDELLKVALEASKKETTRKGFSERSSGAGIQGSRSDAEDDDFMRAVSLSLKTAEHEKTLREGQGSPRSSEFGEIQDDTENIEFSKRDSVEESDELEEEHLLRRGSGQAQNPVPGVHQELRNAAGRTLHPTQGNSEATSNDEWGGLSLEEQEEAVLLEAAIFGQLPDDTAMRLHYPAAFGGITENANGSLPDSNGYHIGRPLQQPTSPSVIAQRLLREQQDDEYLASLVADREKEERAQREEEIRNLKEAEAKAAADKEERLLRCQCLAEEELEKQKAAKQAALPEEPSVDNDNAVAIMVRLPEGARQGRRFLKSDPLQCLLDFIDVSCGPLSGPYQLVRPYPRRAFTDAEHGSSFQELGLNSKYETLFLEVI